jgi:hypothetical protein
VRRGADTGVGQGDRVRVVLDVVHELFHRLGLEVLARHDGHGDLGHQADRLEVLQRVVRQVGVQRRRRRHADVVHEHRVTVRLGVRDLTGRDGAAGTFDVLDDDRSAQLLAHRLRDQPGHRVRRAAGRERHDDRDVSVRVPLGCPLSATAATPATAAACGEREAGGDQADAQSGGAEAVRPARARSGLEQLALSHGRPLSIDDRLGTPERYHRG